METLKGYVDRITFQKNENGWTVLRLIADGKEVTCVGICKGLSQGENIEAQGEYEKHPSYGKQFHIQKYSVVTPTDSAAIERYLGSGAVKGIGASLASRIVSKFGDDTMRIIEEEPERLAEIKGISLRKAQEIAVQMEEKKDLREAMVYLSGFGISNTLAVKIYEKYELDIYRVMKENPYQLAEDIHGVGFKIADEIAARVGIHTDSDYRIRCGVLYALQRAVTEGHVYLPLEMLLDRSAELLELSQDTIRGHINNMVMERKLIIKEEAVFAPSYYYAELNCAKMLHQLDLQMNDLGLPTQEASLDSKLEKLAKKQGMELDELQLNAVKQCIRSGLFILSGGPGTGKTTTINMIIQYFESEGLDIFLAAPTGRAAKRMTEATGYEARTIHRMLELNSNLSDEDSRRVSFERNENNPLEADVIIIDEMSMVDIHIFQALLKAVTPGTRLILVGDVDQLPSVGPGQVLRDVMNSGCFPMVVLKKIFRQAESSDIVMNAHRINRGEPIVVHNKDSKDFFLLERKDEDLIFKHMIELIREKLPGFVNASPFEIQVLTPMRKGSLGCENLNRILQKYLNPQDGTKAEHTSGELIYRVGDKVMQIKNNYQIPWEVVGKYNIVIDEGTGVFNGDMGRIVEIDEAQSQLVVEFDEHKRVTYPFSGLEELEHSYAVTIHKSQGSEYPAVILPLLGGPRMLFNRNLLYTAITRARNCVTILGRSDVVESMIENTSENKRFTALETRIRELAPGEGAE